MRSGPSGPQYRVHFITWKKSQDTWLDPVDIVDFIVEHPCCHMKREEATFKCVQKGCKNSEHKSCRIHWDTWHAGCTKKFLCSHHDPLSLEKYPQDRDTATGAWF